MQTFPPCVKTIKKRKLAKIKIERLKCRGPRDVSKSTVEPLLENWESGGSGEVAIMGR